MATRRETVVVITDANVLINLILIGQLPLLGQLDGHRFLVPPEVVNEITEPDQVEAVSKALAAGYLEVAVVEMMEALQLFAELRDVMGKGEAACLALAATMGCCIASDEKKRFRRRAVELVGEQRIVRTEGLLLAAIRQGSISIGEADRFKAALAANRYVMSFGSFAELL